jgi:hypothetical protein
LQQTTSTNPDWFKDGAFCVMSRKPGEPLAQSPSVQEIKTAVDVYEKGGKIGKRQERILDALSDVAQATEDFHNEGYRGYKLTHAQNVASLLLAYKNISEQDFLSADQAASRGNITPENINEWWDDIDEQNNWDDINEIDQFRR